MSDTVIQRDGIATDGIVTCDTIPENPAHLRREKFIPLRKSDLIDRLCRLPELTAKEQEDFRQLCQFISSTLHFEFHARLEELKALYAPFDPDADTLVSPPLTAEQRNIQAGQVIDRLVWLLERGNFERLSREQLHAAMATMSDWGIRLDVDFTVFDRLEVFARGDIVGKRTRRRWKNLLREEQVDLEIYQRLVLVFRARPHRRLEKNIDPDTVYIKLFKNIPRKDLEMLFPGTRVRMTVVDQGKIFFPTLTGLIITVSKLFSVALVFTTAGLLAMLGVIGGTLGYGFRSFVGYMQCKQKYQLNLTQSLYYQNLDNNQGVLTRLLDEAEDQECREALLGYFFLWKHAGSDGWTTQELDRRIEAFLRQQTNVPVDFEISDSLEKLARLRLIEKTAQGRFKAKPLAMAMVALDNAWDGYFHCHASDVILKPNWQGLRTRSVE